jgi:hypothetical protein
MTRELPPDCVERDFTGTSDDALQALLADTCPRKLKEGIIAQIREHGATHNQRALVRNACLLLNLAHPEEIA